MMVSQISAGLLLAVVVVAAVGDVRTRRIPNLLTVPAFLAALMLGAAQGIQPFVGALAGAGLGFAIGAALLALGGMGGGDAKLLTVVGAFLGPQGFGVAMAATAVTGGLLACALVIHRRSVHATLRSTGGLVAYGATGGRAGKRTTISSPQAITLPYAVPIALGAVLALVLRGGLLP